MSENTNKVLVGGLFLAVAVGTMWWVFSETAKPKKTKKA